MEQKDERLLLELGLTWAAVITAGFLLKTTIFWPYQLLLIFGTIVGFAFGWYNRQGKINAVKYFTDAAILITVAWIGYRVYRSTFLYKEVIAILTQGIIILQIIFSFNFSSPGKIAFIRILSLLVFMTSPVFAFIYNIPLALAYLLVWLGILRFQFKGFAQSFPEEAPGRYYSWMTSLTCFLLVAIMAWFISSNVYLGRIKQGVLLDEDLQDSGPSGGQDSNQADKFYSLQDDLQAQIIDLAAKLGSYEKSRQLIYLFSELIKESLKTMETDKAEIGLVDILKRQGAGLEGSAAAMTLAKEYLNQKNSRQMEQNKEGIVDMLKKHPLGMIDKIKIISLANKIQQASSYQQLKDNRRALQNTIQNSALGKNIKKDLSSFGRKLADSKAYEFYRRKIKKLDQRIPALSQPSERKIMDTFEDLKHTQSLNDFKQTAKEIRQLKNDQNISGQPTGKEAIKDLEEAARLKLDLIFAEKTEQVRSAALRKQDVGAFTEEFDKKMDGAVNAQIYLEFIQEFSGLSQQNKNNNLGLADDLEQVLDLKTEVHKQIEKNRLDNWMEKGVPVQAKQEVTESLEILEEQEKSADLESQLGELVDKVRGLEKKGEVSPAIAAGLVKAATDFKNLLEEKLQAQAELKSGRETDSSLEKYDYFEQLQQAITESSLNNQNKETLRALSEQLIQSQSLSELEEVKEGLDNKVSSLALQGAFDKNRKNQLNELKTLLANLERRIDNLENLTAAQISQLQGYLNRLQQAKDLRELENIAQEFAQAIGANPALDKQEQARMLADLQKLKEIIRSLLGKKVLTPEEFKEVNRINEKVNQVAEIKRQFLSSQFLTEILERIEALSAQDEKKAQELQNKLDQLRESKAPEEVEKIIADLKNIINKESEQKNKVKPKDEENQPEFKIYIIAAPLIVAPGKTVPLKVIAIYNNGYIKELSRDVEWFSTNPQVAWVDDFNFLRPLALGRTKIKVVYKRAVSQDTDVHVVEDLDSQTVQSIKREIGQ